jgi:hypothetical protein
LRGPNQTQSGHGTGTIVLDHDIARQHQVAGEIARCRVFQVERDRALAPVDRGEVLAETNFVGVMSDGWPLPHGVAVERLDLGDLGAVIGQQHAAKRPGGHMAKLDHADAGQRQIDRVRHQFLSFMPALLS